MNIKQNLRALCSLPGVAGHEGEVAAFAADLLRPYMDEVRLDRLGGVVGVRRGSDPSAPTLLLDAHLDSVGLVVSGYTDEGFLRFFPIGIDPRVLPGREVLVLAKGERLFGVVTCLPPHVQTAEEAKKATKAADMAIDLGFCAERVRSLVPLGSPVMFAGELTELGGDSLCGPSLDDRAGFALILDCLDRLGSDRLSCTLAVTGSTQEEVGLRGVRAASWNLDPAYAVVVDMTHGKTPDSSEDDSFRMGGGPAIGLGPNMHRGLSERLIECAEASGIPYQLEVMERNSGTNAQALQTSREGVACAVLSVPVKYMHTPFEVVRLSDLAKASALLCAFIKDFSGRRPLER